ncbi:hypothetical protein BJ508DRAFT_411842 [Ascobolus immersus RN42]|uniref:DUF7905 domain-containing protein n=1 Tax=Ascobolus immersus RN42 TaxID=1160509 RepID=A0A3N4INT6_ASCIM|nr:hypothetical protein BJ508DRAFT_411842 [Ascobolus immersus RN42]
MSRPNNFSALFAQRVREYGEQHGHSNQHQHFSSVLPTYTNNEPLINFSDVNNAEAIAASYFGVPNATDHAYAQPESTAGPTYDEVIFQAQQNLANLPSLPVAPGPIYSDYNPPEGFAWRDNENDMAERAGFPPASQYELPEGRPDGFEDLFFGPRHKNILHIAHKTGAHLSTPRDMDRSCVDIWGNQKQIADAKRDLSEFADHIMAALATKGKRPSRDFARIRAAPSARQIEHKREQIRDNKRKQKLKQEPEEPYYNASGIFHWPSDLVEPRAALGPSCEALDHIRFDCNVHIVYKPKRSAFRIYAGDALQDDPVEAERQVAEAINRIYGVYCELSSKNRYLTRVVMVDYPRPENCTTHVLFLRRHEQVGKQLSYPLFTAKGAPNVNVMVTMAGTRLPDGVYQAYAQAYPQLKLANQEYLRALTQRSLEHIYYYRGHCKLKVYIGHIVLYDHMKPNEDDCLPFDRFVNSTQGQQKGRSTKGELVRNLGGEDVACHIVNECAKRSDVFIPLSYGDVGEQQSIVLSASFNIRLHCSNDRMSELRLDVNFDYDPKTGDQKVHSSTWSYTRLSEPPLNRRTPLQANVIDLENDMGWSLELSTYKLHRDTDLYPIFSQFLRKLRFDSIQEAVPGGVPVKYPRISYTPLPGMTVESLVQKTRHLYTIKNTEYIFELTKYEHIDCKHIRLPEGVPSYLDHINVPKSAIDVRFGCAMYRTKWSTDLLAEQRSLPLGKPANWQCSVDTFFPYELGRGAKGKGKAKQEKGDGWVQFLEYVQECVNVVAAGKRAAAEAEGVDYGAILEEDHEYVGDI